MSDLEPGGPCALSSDAVPSEFLRKLAQAHGTLSSRELLSDLAQAVALEESVYRAGHKNNYFADRFGIDVLTDTTERSPTYCTPPFRKFDDRTATESWAFLFLPDQNTPQAWESILKRKPQCIAWTEPEIRELVREDQVARTREIVGRIGEGELMRFRVGLDGLQYRPLGEGDSAVAIVSEFDKSQLLAEDGFFRKQLEAARDHGAQVGVIFLGSEPSLNEVRASVSDWAPDCRLVLMAVPPTDFLLDGVTRVALKFLLNALSTCTMVRLGRVMGNCMVWVVPSNLKLIDRSTRYIQKLTGLEYARANQLLFEVIEYVEPRMKADQAYPPVVGLAVLRARSQLGNREAEEKLMRETLGNPE